jgi:F0F1-type ATP synthase delta subunit
MNQEIRDQIKQIIYKAIKLNEGVFDKALKTRLKSILEKKIISLSEKKYNLLTPIDLSKKDIEEISTILHQPDVTIIEKKDDDLIGGFILKSESKMIDGSINGYITNLTRQMANN